MSLDRPFYDELRRRKHPAAKWWRLGDALYYLGLIPAIVVVGPAIVALARINRPTEWDLWMLALFVGCAATFLLGTRLKLRSWRMAAKDGINVNDY